MSITPQRIDSFRIVEKLGHGGMGEVYLAHDENLDRRVAIKLIRTSEVGSATSQERFRREARTVAALDHPSIVRVHHVLQWEDRDCIVMEYVEGQTLTAFLRAGQPKLSQILGMAREMAEALAVAHAQGIVHRDLKSENVMVTPDGRTKILDFGLAKNLRPSANEASLSEDGRIVGTFHSMSPEQAQGEKVDHRSDLFSFGTLLYQLTTGKRPFYGENVTEVLAQVCMHRQIPARELEPSIPPGLSDLIDRLLEKRPERRPQTALDVAEALTRLAGQDDSEVGTEGKATEVAGAPLVDSDRSTWKPPAKARQSKRRAGVVAAAVTVPAVLGILFLAFSDVFRARDLSSMSSTSPQLLESATAAFEKGEDLDQALVWALELVEIARDSADPLLEAKAWRLHGYILEKQGRPQECLISLSKARMIFERIGNKEDLNFLFAYTATIMVDLGEPDKARALFERLHSTYRDEGDQLNAAMLQMNYANALGETGHHAMTIPLYEQALKAFEALQEEDYKTKTQMNLGTTLHSMGRLGEARRYYERAYLTFSMLEEQEGMATTISNVGEIDFVYGELDQALRAFEKAKSIFLEKELRSETAYPLYWKGRVYAAMGKIEEAEKSYGEALAIQLEVGLEGDAAQTQIGLARLRLHLGEADQARQLADQAQEALWTAERQDEAAVAETVLAMALLAQGEIEKAREIADAAENHADVGENPSVGRTARIVAARVAAASKDPTKIEAAIRKLESVVAEASETGLVADELEARFHLGILELEAGREGAQARLKALAAEAGDEGFVGIVQRVERLFEA